MLQRIQTVFLIVVVLLMTASLFFNFWEYKAAETGMSYAVTPFGLEIDSTAEDAAANGFPKKESVPYILLAVLAIAGITIAAFEITKFKNRLLQIKLGTLNSVILAAVTILGVYLSTDLAKSVEGLVGAPGISTFLAPAALICNALANRFIHRDEKLVRSVDRIR